MGQPEDDADEPHKGAGGRGRRGPKGGGGKQGGKGPGKGPAPASGLGNVRQCAFKVLCTDPLAANLIGREGSARAAMQEETGCSVWISKRDEVFPAPPFRILVLHADEPGQVFHALEGVVANLMEVAGREREPDSPLLGKEPGQFAIHVALPTLITGKLIGKAGANISMLKDKTGAWISVDPDIFDGHKAGRIIGYPDNIRHALRIINDLVQEEAGSEDYGNWALTQPLGAPSSKGKGGPREGHHQPEPWVKQRDTWDDHAQHDRSWHESRSPKRARRGRNAQSGPQPPTFGRVPEGPPLQCLDVLAHEFREGELERNHAVTCTLPRGHVDVLAESDGEYLGYIERSTGTKIDITDGDIEGYANLMITGPLLSVYVAHMSVMKTYHDKEHERTVKQQQEQDQQQQHQQQNVQVEELQAQLATLQSQLRQATRGSGARPRSSMGKGKR